MFVSVSEDHEGIAAQSKSRCRISYCDGARTVTRLSILKAQMTDEEMALDQASLTFAI